MRESESRRLEWPKWPREGDRHLTFPRIFASHDVVRPLLNPLIGRNTALRYPYR